MIRAILLFLLVFSFIQQPAFAEDPPLPTPIGRVIWVKGELRATMPNKEVRILQKSSVIYLDDTLSTDANSQAQIAFTDNTLMTFYPSTIFHIDQYKYNPKGKKGSIGTFIVQLIEGGFRTITGLIAKSNPDDYTVNTPVGTIGVRGTDYAVFIKKTPANGSVAPVVKTSDELYMAQYKGEPCVKNGQGSVCLKNNDRYAKATPGKAPEIIVSMPDVFHTQLEIVPASIGSFGSSTAAKNDLTKQPINSFCIQ